MSWGRGEPYVPREKKCACPIVGFFVLIWPWPCGLTHRFSFQVVSLTAFLWRWVVVLCVVVLLALMRVTGPARVRTYSRRPYRGRVAAYALMVGVMFWPN